MSSTAVEALRQQIASCESMLKELRQQLTEAEHSQQLQEKILRQKPALSHDPLDHDMNFGVPDDFRSEVFAVLEQEHKAREDADGAAREKRWPLDKNEYKRYGRQLIMPEVGLQGQLRLKKARVLIVGVGGLGCPAAAYLIGAGVGTVGLVDGDVVEESNLHRQILHSTARVGMTKVESAMIALTSLNPSVELIPHKARLTPETAISTFKDYDLVLDCTDTPASRYLISDTCVLLGKRLVSASALRIDGQLMVLNNPPLPPGNIKGGPCYRCVFPRPPPPESVLSCGDGGILGPVVGVMGVLQALEAIKLIAQQPSSAPPDPPSLLIFSAYSQPMFRSIRLRSRKPKCAACSSQSSISAGALDSGSLDYIQFCGSVDQVNALTPQERISPENFAKLRSGVNPFTGTKSSKDSHILIDTREQVQFELGNIDGSVNIPFSVIQTTPRPTLDIPSPRLSEQDHDMDTDGNKWVEALRRSEKPIFVVCRKGNDSQISVQKMKQLGLDHGGKRFIGDIRGGLEAWRKSVDSDFPDY
ncbi:molybdopterin biosynthesis protein moeB [Ampelomyces quisqualis]|uniref:Adenylyltransferase and sulfurtransferase uba4 n=1 Tax=Ampelomyces quisqualis TaxID=50730 RepID=A0A6A5QFB7_AMPQU|nr:molybdopterin biosynthesis protein moeB [Ampelomyces quisqualis]